MLILEFELIEVDFCEACRGIWLDAGELELLFGDRKISEGFLSAGNPAEAKAEKPRACPICLKKMGKAVTGGEKPVTYDHCARGHGMWFDRGELTTILKYGSDVEGGGEVARLLREMFPEEEKPGA